MLQSHDAKKKLKWSHVYKVNKVVKKMVCGAMKRLMLIVKCYGHSFAKG